MFLSHNVACCGVIMVCLTLELLLPLQVGNAMYLVLQHTWSASLPSNCSYEGREFLEQRWQVGISPHVSWGNVHQDVNTGLSFYYGPVK
jgi:hypothetical protein